MKHNAFHQYIRRAYFFPFFSLSSFFETSNNPIPSLNVNFSPRLRLAKYPSSRPPLLFQLILIAPLLTPSFLPPPLTLLLSSCSSSSPPPPPPRRFFAFLLPLVDFFPFWVKRATFPHPSHTNYLLTLLDLLTYSPALLPPALLITHSVTSLDSPTPLHINFLNS